MKTEEVYGTYYCMTLAPLYLLAIIGAIVLALVMLDRHLIGPQTSFFNKKSSYLS